MPQDPSRHQRPPSAERSEFTHQETLQYEDGRIALGFRKPGDTLTLGQGSTHKYARHFRARNPIDMALIQTESGNVYGVAGGLVVNKDKRNANDLPEEPIHITIGERCLIPGVSLTTPVTSVQLRYKDAWPGRVTTAQQMSGPSPFVELERVVDIFNSQAQPR